MKKTKKFYDTYGYVTQAREHVAEFDDSRVKKIRFSYAD